MTVLHPGQLIEPLVLAPTGISQSELARRLGFNQPQPVNELVNGKRNFTPKMALLFEQVTEGQIPAVFWLAAQALHDLEVAREGMAPGRRSAVDPLHLNGVEADDSEAVDCQQLLVLSRTLAAMTRQ